MHVRPSPGAQPLRRSLRCGHLGGAAAGDRGGVAEHGGDPQPEPPPIIPPIATILTATLDRHAPASRLLDREFLAAPFIHALGKLNSFKPVPAQNAGGGR
jgi:hypothetical protein